MPVPPNPNFNKSSMVRVFLSELKSEFKDTYTVLRWTVYSIYTRILVFLGLLYRSWVFNSLDVWVVIVEKIAQG